VNKFATMRRWLNGGPRIYQCFRYHGAMPGRFTSIGVQVQNLKKPEVADVATAIETVRTGSLAQMRARGYERPLEILGDISRATVIAASGNRLFDVDLSGIESRGLALLTNETSKLEQWRKFDRTGRKEDEPYYIFGTDVLKLDESKARNTGKTGDLAFGYQGSIGAWRKMAPPGDATPDHKVREFRQAWVRAHPNIAKFWGVALRQALNAIEHPGECFTASRITFVREGRFLHLELPNGRRIRYPHPRLYEDYSFDDNRRLSFTFRDASGGRWEWYHVLKKGRGAFGGLIAENATQAVCRDVFCDAMLRLEAAGYHIVAHLHDQFVCEVLDGFGSLEEFIAIITVPPAWAPDFPIAAKGRITDRLIEIKEPKATIDPAPAIDAYDDDDTERPSVADEAIEIEDVPEPIAVDPLPSAPLPWEDDPSSPLPSQENSGSDTPEEGLLEAPATPSSPQPSTPDEEEPTSEDESSPDPEPDSDPEPDPVEQDSYQRGETLKDLSPTTATYVYKDAQRRLYMKVIRTANKSSFPTYRWEDGAWVKGWPKEAIPYRLPELLAAPPDEPIWLCEGEKDSDNVAALGLVATTNPGGATNPNGVDGKWQSELNQWFKGKKLSTSSRIMTAPVARILPRSSPTCATSSPSSR
jgi:DNA polymerase